MAACVLGAAALRTPSVGLFPFPDESGLLLVAGHWRDDGPQLYGHLFVDRPPGLLLFFAAAHALGGILAVRWLGVLMVAWLVVAAGRSGWLLGGRRGALWAAAVAGALASNPATGAREVNAELIGVPLIVTGAALALDAVRRPHRPAVRLALLSVAGLAAALAPTVKQNLVDGLVFVAVLMLTHDRRDGRSRRGLALDALAVAFGALLPTVSTVLWAALAGPGLSVMWDSLYGFRVDAGKVLATTPSPANQQRLLLLPLLAVASGLVTLLASALWLVRRRLARPEVVAAGAMLLVEIAGLAAGGSYWSHYLIALIPGVTLLVAASAPAPGRRWPVVAAIGFAVSSAVVATAVPFTPILPLPSDRREEAVTTWLRQARHPGDTGLVTYGQAQLLEAADLTPDYFLWSLPARTLDPRLRRLGREIRSPHGPAWIIEWMPVDTWGLDRLGRVSRAIDHHYREVGRICDVPVYLRNDLDRSLPAAPRCG